MGKRATLKDVAREADVTPATVSYVINNTPGQSIRPETRKRVLEAARKLKYAPNAHARTLRNHHSPCIGMVIRKNLAVPRFSQMAYGIQTKLEQEGYNALLLGNKINNLGIADYAEAFLAGRVGGIIFIGTDNQGPDERSLKVLADEHAPLVVFDTQTQADSYSTVDLDYVGGARLSCERVLSRGCKRVLYFRPDIDKPQETLREQGVRETCEAAGVELVCARSPITLGNIELWDARYVGADTEEGLRLSERFLASVANALELVDDGDAVISSWATWTHYFRRIETQRGSRRRLTYAELANNGESWLAADLYTRLPNYEAGAACAEDVLALMRTGVPSARIMKLSNIIEAPLGQQAPNY